MAKAKSEQAANQEKSSKPVDNTSKPEEVSHSGRPAARPEWVPYGAVLRQARKTHGPGGLTLQTVAKFLRMPHTSIANYETAQSVPPVLVLRKLAQFYGISVDALFRGRLERS